MKNLSFICLCLLLPGFISGQARIAFEEKLWHSAGDAHWEFGNATVTGFARGNGGFLISKEAFSDFELSLEFFPDSSINSGVFIACRDSLVNPFNCYEINIWDLHPEQKWRTGAIVTRQSATHQLKSIGKWNFYRIRMKGGHLQVWLNGVLVSDIHDANLNRGFIALQASGSGKVRFRNIELRPLKQAD